MVLVGFPGWDPQQSQIHDRFATHKELQIHEQHGTGKMYIQKKLSSVLLYKEYQYLTGPSREIVCSPSEAQQFMSQSQESLVAFGEAALPLGIMRWQPSDCHCVAGLYQGMQLKESLLVGKRGSVLSSLDFSLQEKE